VDRSTLPILRDRVAELEGRGGAALPVGRGADGRLDASDILDGLSRRGIHSLLLEGGASVYGLFLNGGLVRNLHLFQAPTLFGGDTRLHWSRAFDRLSTRGLEDVEITPLDEDWVIEGRVRADEVSRA
jgi:riboflavin biosynthesis pyrimidine reductase